MDIIVSSTNLNPEEDDVVIDLDSLPDNTLRDLQTYIRGVVRSKANREKFQAWEDEHGEYVDEEF